MRATLSTPCAALAAAALTCGAAGANCALRNPDRQIYEIFPDATSYRSVVAAVDAPLKERIEAVLGGELTLADIGKHTAYVVLEKDVPIGIVHARTEVGERGSIELVWAMDLRMHIKDFRVQRSRDRQTDAIEADEFRQRLVGRDLGDLRSLLSADNEDIDLAALQVPPAAAGIAHKVVLCGVKTRIITDLAFREALQPARQLGLAHSEFPKAARITRISGPLDDGATRAVRELLGATPGQLSPDEVTLLPARDAGDGLQGVLAFTVWTAHPARPETWWWISPEGIITQVAIVGDVEAGTRATASVLRGNDLATLDPGGAPGPGSVRQLAREVLAIVAVRQLGAAAGPAE